MKGWLVAVFFLHLTSFSTAGSARTQYRHTHTHTQTPGLRLKDKRGLMKLAVKCGMRMAEVWRLVGGSAKAEITRRKKETFCQSQHDTFMIKYIFVTGNSASFRYGLQLLWSFHSCPSVSTARVVVIIDILIQEVSPKLWNISILSQLVGDMKVEITPEQC